MAEPSWDHPDPARLVAFGRGILDREEMAEVESHLAVCEACGQVLSTLPDDGFVDRLRTAQKHVDLVASLGIAAQSSGTPSEALDVPEFEVASVVRPARIACHPRAGGDLSGW
jgi:hypothetical protein